MFRNIIDPLLEQLMNPATKSTALTADLLQASELLIDNIFAMLWQWPGIEPY